MQHVSFVRGMQMKNEEPYGRFEECHQNDLKHVNECCHACCHVLDVLLLHGCLLIRQCEANWPMSGEQAGMEWNLH